MAGTVTVKEWMTGDPVSIDPGASALAALDAMIDRGVRHLPVVDAGRRVVGLLTIDDLRAAMPAEIGLRRPPSVEARRAVRDFAVGELMVHAPDTVDEDAPLDEAAQRMADGRLSALPVVDESGRLAGILSETDVLHAIATTLWTDRVRQRRGAEQELGALVDAMRAERERIRRGVVASGRAEAELEAEARASGLDEPERAADLSGARVAESLHDLAAKRLAHLDHAIALADRGALARCERCGGAIPLARLRALPGTTTCVACARALEGGG
jgi:acetoin utilization protein AcuB